MLELISLICCIYLLVATPGQIRKLRAGFVPPKFKGDAAAYRVAYRKQLTMLIWLGTVFGGFAILIGLLALGGIGISENTGPVVAIVKWVIAGIWIALAVSMSGHRRRFDEWVAEGAPTGTAPVASIPATPPPSAAPRP